MKKRQAKIKPLAPGTSVYDIYPELLDRQPDWNSLYLPD